MSAKSFLCSLLVLVAVARTAPATTVFYMESASGDLPANGSLTSFTLDLGLNQIIGNNSNVGGNVDLDSFAFIVPAGMQMHSGGVSIINMAGQANNNGWRIRTGSTFDTGTLLEDVNINAPNSKIFTSAPLLGGTYNMSNYTFDATAESTNQYVFSFNVSTVLPEPSSLILAAFGAVALRRTYRSTSR